MAKGVRVKKGSIPSLSADLSFWKKLGKITEAQLKERLEKKKARIEAEIETRRTEIQSRTFYKTEEEKIEAIKEMEESRRSNFRSDSRASYTFKTSDDQEISFSSMDDVLETEILPDNVISFSFHVFHFNDNYVDISLYLNKPTGFLFFADSCQYSLSSNDEGSLLKIERELKDIFKQSRSNYHKFLYPPVFFSYIWIFLASLLASWGITRFLLNSSADLNNFISVTGQEVTLVLLYYFVLSALLRSVFPFYELKLTTNSNWKNDIRWLLGALLLGLLVNGIYEIIKVLV